MCDCSSCTDLTVQKGDTGADATNGTNGTNGVNGIGLLYGNPNVLASSASSSDDTLATITVPANTLKSSGDILEIEGMVKDTVVTHASPVYLQIALQNNSVTTLINAEMCYIPPVNGFLASFKARIMMVNTNSFRYNSEYNTFYNQVILPASSLPISSSVNFTGSQSITVKIIKNGIATNTGIDIYNLTVKFFIQ